MRRRIKEGESRMKGESEGDLKKQGKQGGEEGVESDGGWIGGVGV